MSTTMASSRIHSMTGFARVRVPTAAGEVTISLRSVNHRGLDLHFHTPPDFDPVEGKMRKRIGECLKRGHVDVRISVQRGVDRAAPQWNRALLATWLAAFEEARQNYGFDSRPDLNSALRVPGMLSATETEDLSPETETAILDGLDEALRQLNEVRAREGAETAATLRAIGARIGVAATGIESIRGGVTAALQSRLNERLAELLQGAAIDPQRVIQEAAVLADRSDVGEETTRLKIHSTRLEELLAAGGEIGKKLEFLLQEMHRETNTILSKSNAAGEAGREITRIALELKSEIERIREQSLNLE
jgi:uncharacterized protein (TIGR00255 family)